jgi:single-stranded-DNA-specific exonuclease
MKKIIRKQSTIHADELQHLHPILQKVFANRGVVAKHELERNLTALLPFKDLMNIDHAAELLFATIANEQRILIIGDFDADGATSCAVAVSALRALGAKYVDFLVPNRFEYGYGLTPEIVAVAVTYKPDLIITVDNGISSIAGVAAAKEQGIKVLITDHHLPGVELPAADVIVNPNQAQDQFASKNLAGVGVIFYVMLALRSYLREQNWFADKKIPEPNMGDFLDLVALGTVADVVPLDKNNRILVHQGLLRIRQGNARPGIKALINVANRNSRQLTATDLAFAIGPRLNAAGRLDDMALGIQCLLSQTDAEALSLATILDEMNQERRQIEQEMQTEALKNLAKLKFSNTENLPQGLCLYDENWHQGVIGILAGRIKERFHRPTIVFAKASDTELKGSARSIDGLHIRDILDAVATKNPNLITKFGGHAMAAGLSLPIEHYHDFANAFDQEVRVHASEALLQQIIHSDGELQQQDFSLGLANEIQQAGPWGQAFPEPIFDGDFELLEQRLVGQKHLKMTVKAQDKILEAIAFNIDLQKWPNYRCKYVRMAYRLDINEFRGIRSLQLMVEHLEELEL